MTKWQLIDKLMNGGEMPWQLDDYSIIMAKVIGLYRDSEDYSKWTITLHDDRPEARRSHVRFLTTTID